MLTLKDAMQTIKSKKAVNAPKRATAKKVKPFSHSDHVNVTATFGEGNICSLTVPSKLKADDIKLLLKKKFRNITKAVLDFPNGMTKELFYKTRQLKAAA